MASVEQRGNWFRIVFRHDGHRYAARLNTNNAAEARGMQAIVERTLLLLVGQAFQAPEDRIHPAGCR